MNFSELVDRVRDAAERGQQAFWHAIAESFPEATSGDFSPEATLAFEKSLILAVFRWTRNNLPEPTTVFVRPSTSPLHRLSDHEWENETFKAWLANDHTRLAELMALGEEDRDDR